MPRRKKQPQTNLVPKAQDEKIPVAVSESMKLLGDFTSIRESLTTFKPFHNLLRSDCPGDGAVQLGNLSKIINQLRDSNTSPDQNTEAFITPVQEVKKPPNRKTALPDGNGSQSQRTRPKTILKRKNLAPTSDSDYDSRTHSESNDALTPATTPPTPPNKFRQPVVPKDTPSEHTQASHDLLAILREESKHSKDTSHVQPLLSYRMSKASPVSVIWGTLRTKDEAHESLGVKLVMQHTYDRLTSISHPSAASNGIHVFLDMSNIEISFQHTLRVKHKLPETIRFSPLPQLNLEFFSEILTRGRSARSLHVGCSMKPGHQQPRYVHDLRQLGYHVDLRTRRRLEDVDPFEQRPRYVEDLVDETLQTRIGEAVMEHYTEQGTIVLATGDAKPAQYSDGFLVYVDRALRMGWNVEVVSWKSSLSEAWRDFKTNGEWGDRFRIIELDDFLDELLACYK